MVRRGRTTDDAKQIERNAALAGVRLGATADPVTEVWPDNWMPMKVAQAMSTQWNVGPMGGISGMRYEAMPFVLRTLDVRASDRADVFWGVQVIEAEILKLKAQSHE